MLEPVGCVATAVDGYNCLAMLVRRDGETLAQLLTRLDLAVGLAFAEDRVSLAGMEGNFKMSPGGYSSIFSKALGADCAKILDLHPGRHVSVPRVLFATMLGYIMMCNPN